MITGRQIRAARGLLEWTGADLARRAEVTPLTISKVESDLVQPQEKTLNKILSVFDRQGVEFIDDEGVRIRKQQVRVFTGKAGYRQLLNHIYDTLKESGGRIRQFNFSDGKYLAYADNFVETHLKRMGEIDNLDAKVLTVESEANLQVSYSQYRWLDKAFKNLTPYYVYNDNVVLALNEMGYKREFVSINCKFLAERYVEQFDVFWGMAKKLKGTGRK